VSKKPAKKAASKSFKVVKPAAKKTRAPRATKKAAPAAALTAAAPAPVATPPSRESIAVLACDLWDRQGRPSGRDLEFWLEAERALSRS
jgi:hypothetical protein